MTGRTRRLALLLVATTLATCLPRVAGAQAVPPVTSAPSTAPVPGDPPHDAPATGAKARSFALRPAPLDGFHPTRVAALQERGRHTKRGALIGGGIGALGGFGAGVFISLLCASEGDDDDCRGVVPIMTLLGAGAGALGGAIIGAAIPRAGARAGPAPADSVPDAPAARRRIGSASLAASFVGARSGMVIAPQPDEAWRAGVGLRFNFFAELGSWFAIGPQLGMASLERGGGVRHAALAVRASRPGQRIAPYLVADLGAYQSRQDVTFEGYESTGTLEFLGGSLGAGARVFPFSSNRLFLDVDARWHRHAQNIEPFDMTALSLGLGRVW